MASGVEPSSGGKVGTATRRERLDNAGPVRRSAVPRTEKLEQNVGLGRWLARIASAPSELFCEMRLTNASMLRRASNLTPAMAASSLDRGARQTID